MFNACFVAGIFLLLADQARFIPLAALAGVLIVIAIGLVEWSYIPRIMRASRPDAVVCAITFIATLFARLEYGIFIGIFLNIALSLRQPSRLHVRELLKE